MVKRYVIRQLIDKEPRCGCSKHDEQTESILIEPSEYRYGYYNEIFDYEYHSVDEAETAIADYLKDKEYPSEKFVILTIYKA